jgi:hypothetical protein
MCKRFPFERYAVFRAAVFLVRLFFLATHKAMGKIYIAKCKLPHTLLPHLRVASIALSSPTILKSKLPTHQPSCRNQRVVPVPKHGLHVARHTFHDDGRDRHKRAVFLRDGEDAVFLREEEGGGERLALRAG